MRVWFCQVQSNEWQYGQLSLVAIPSSTLISTTTDTLDFFPSCSYVISVLSFCGTSDMPRTDSSSVVSQGGSVLVLTVLGRNPPRLGPFRPSRINGPGPQTNGPHNSPSKSCCPTLWSGEEDFDNAQPSLWLIRLGLLLVLAGLHLPGKQIRLQDILTNSFVMRSRRLTTRNAPLMTYFYETT